MNLNNYMSTSEYAKVNNYHRNYIWRMCRDKRIKGAVWLGRGYLVPKNAKISEVRK